VADRFVDPGAVVDQDTPVLRVISEGPLKVRFAIPVNRAPGIEPGTSLLVQVDQGPRLSATVQALTAVADPVLSIVVAEARLADTLTGIYPGVPVKVSLAAPARPASARAP
jgi:hypothetical protein